MELSGPEFLQKQNPVQKYSYIFSSYSGSYIAYHCGISA